MKKIIVAALSVILGAFGYTVVDQAIETRVANLEAQVSIQQSVIDAMELASDFMLARDMSVGTEMICIPSEPTVYTLDNGAKVNIESFTSTVYEHRTLGKLCDDAGLTEYAETLFKYEISGKTDPKYANGTINFTIDSTYKQFYLHAWIDSDGSFSTSFIRPFIKEFASEIRHIHINISSWDVVTTGFPSTTKATTTTLPIEETTKKPTTTMAHTTTYPYSTTTSVSSAYETVSGYCGDYAQWELTSDGTLTIWGEGDMYNASPEWSSYKKSIKKVIIKEGITSVGEGAFSSCTNLISINIPDSVKSIRGDAFSGCTSIRSINIPDSVTSIGGGVFSNCTSLTSVNIPDGVTEIGWYAFSNCTNLTNISIPDSVKAICGYAFRGCTSLKTVTIGKGMERVGDMAFAGCGSLTDVYYAGTEAEWSEIGISTNNARLTDANIHYNYTT